MMHLSILFLLHLFQADPPIVVARDTTYITEPLRPNGLPDYEKYVLELDRKGATPDNNAAVLLWQAMMPGQVPAADIEPVSRELGLPTAPSENTSLKRLYGKANEQQILKWLQQNGQPNATEDRADILLDRALARPWKTEDFPPLRVWGRDNNSAINMIVAATRRSEFYFPSPSLINNVHEPLIDTLLPGPATARDAARALAFRAMAILGNGRFDPAWQDILAIHRLANFVEQDGSLTGQAVAAGIRRVACNATAALVSQDSIPAQLLRQFQRDLAALPEFSGVAHSLDSFERVAYLDSILWLKAGHAEAWGKYLGLDADGINRIVQVTRLPADWNIVLRRGNEQFDQMVAASRTPPGTVRNSMVSKIDTNRDRFHKDFHDRIKTVINLNPQQRADLFFEMTINLFATDLQPLPMFKMARTTICA